MGRSKLLDELDLKILKLLTKNARMSITEIAQHVGKPRSTVNARIEKLMRLGIIKGYTAVIDPRDLGYKICAYVFVSVRRGGQATVGGKSLQIALCERILEDTSKRSDLPWVEEANIVTGPFDIVLKVWAKDINQLTKLLIEYMPSLPSVEKTETHIVLTNVGKVLVPPIEVGD